MTRQQILPTVLIVIDIGAALMYLNPFDYRKFFYWGAAAVLTYCVTY